MTSYPDMVDSDGDGLYDDEDPYRLIYNCYREYNRTKSVDYAIKWFNNYNSLYYCYDSDCTNFVSQCLYAGGIPENEDWYSHRGEIDKLLLGWFLSCAPSEIEFDGKEYCIGYKGQNILYKWDVSDAWNSVKSNRKHFENDNYSLGLVKIDRFDDISTLIEKENIQIGDIVYFDHTDNDDFNHAAIISKLEAGKIYYAAHTKSRDYQDIEKYLNNFEDGHTDPTIFILKMRDKVIIE